MLGLFFLKPKNFKFIILVILLLGLIFISTSSFAASVSITSCPSLVQTVIQVTGLLVGDQEIGGPCPLGDPCVWWYLNYDVTEVEQKMDGNNWGSPGWGTDQDAQDGQCGKATKCQGKEYRGWFNTGNLNISALSDGSHKLRIRAKAKTWGYADCDFTKDSTAPTCSIGYPDGWINSSSFTVSITAIDATSGVAEGDVETKNIPKDGSWPSSWSDYGNYISNFTFNGSHCYFYKFRYKCKDNAGNWSGWDNPGYTTKIDIVDPTADISYITGDEVCDSFTVTLNESDDCSGVGSGLVQKQEKAIGGTWGSWVDYKTTKANFSFTGTAGRCYKFRYKTTDNAGNTSTWDTEERVCIIDCPDDECVGTTWRDHYCSANACAYTDYPNDSRCIVNNPPNIPTLIAPSHNVWINYNPTFQATVSDPDNDQVEAEFSITGYGSGGLGDGLVNSGNISSWGPVNLGTCFQNWWNARARDEHLLFGDWSGSRYVKVDKVAPSATIDQENGISTDTSIWVNLSESDVCSGVVEGDVDVRINGGSWVNTGLPNGGSTMNDFVYTGVDNNTYEFRYQVKDNAGNWSGFDYDGSVTIDLNDSPTTDCIDAETWYYCTDSRNPKLEWTYDDGDGDLQESYQLQIDDNSGFGSPEIDTGEVFSSGTSYQPSGETLNWNTAYYWRIKVKDDQGNWSVWCLPICSFTTPEHAYPDPDFSWKPLKPSALESVQFTDETEFDNGANSWDWTFENPVPASSVLQNPIATFSSAGSWDVTLEATDSDGYMCPKTHTIKVSQPLPEWREVKPSLIERIIALVRNLFRK